MHLLLQKCWLGKMSACEENQRGLNKAMHSGELSLPDSLGGVYLTEQHDSAGRQVEKTAREVLI